MGSLLSKAAIIKSDASYHLNEIWSGFAFKVWERRLRSVFAYTLLYQTTTAFHSLHLSNNSSIPRLISGQSVKKVGLEEAKYSKWIRSPARGRTFEKLYMRSTNTFLQKLAYVNVLTLQNTVKITYNCCLTWRT